MAAEPWTSPASPTDPEPGIRAGWRRWLTFWFPAADPTTLGFVRITTGLLVLYIHLAYSVDLQQFFGEHGWYAHRFIERERHEYPWHVSPFWDWDLQGAVPARVPDFPHRRKAVIDYCKNLDGDPTKPADLAERKRRLAFLRRLVDAEDQRYAQIALEWVRQMGMHDAQLERFLKVLKGESLTTEGETQVYQNRTPGFLLAGTPAERAAVAEEIRAFFGTLPKPQLLSAELGYSRDYEYILNHLIEIPPEFRRAFVEFLEKLPTDPVARAQKIEYLDYWNGEEEKTLRTGHSIFSVWFHVKDPTGMALVHTTILIIIALFTVGLFTRVTSVLTWLAVVGYIHRTQQVLFGMDTMMNILLFYLMIGNSGAALSLDRLIARYRAVRASLRRTGTIDAPTRAFLTAPPPSRSAGFAIRLIQVHFCIIYLAAGFSKLKGPGWWGGQAFWDVMMNPEFTLMQFEWYEKFLRWCVSSRPVYYFLGSTGVWFTLFIEIAGPFLMWTRLRWLIIFLASLMHAIIGVLMGLNLFELLMMIMIIAFIPDRVIRDRLAGGVNLAKLTFVFNPVTAVCARAAALLAALDTEGQVTFTPNPAVGSPEATDAGGNKLSGPTGTTAVFKTLRLLAPLSLLLYLPGMRGLMTRLMFPTPASTPPPTSTKPGAPAAAS